MRGRTEVDKNALTSALGASRRTFTVVGLFSFCINLLMLTVPIYMLQIYDRVLTSRSVDSLIMLSVLAVGLLILNGSLEFVRARVLVRVGARLDNVLNEKVFSAILRHRLQGEDLRSQPIRDLDSIRSFLTGPALLAFFDAPWTPFFLALIFIFHPLLGFVATGGAILLFCLALLNELTTRKPLGQASHETMRASGFAESTLRNAEAIEAMGMGPALQKRWLQRHLSGLALQAKASDRAGLVTAVVKVCRPMLQIAMLATGAYLAIQQIITPGVMIAASIILGRALAPVEVAVNGWRGFVGVRGAHRRLRETLADLEEERQPMKLPAPRGTLAVEISSAGPPGVAKPVLRKVAFGLALGEALGVIGPSAAGKSTLARLLVGVWRARSGCVRLDGADIADWEAAELGPYIGYLPQDVELFEGSVAENIARFSDGDPALVVAAAKRAGVHETILRLPEGYDTLIGDGLGVLSGGQRQRIGLARALFGDPALIVLDEPNSNLDADGEAALRSAILELKQLGKTIVIISHRPNVLGVVDKVLLLREGRVEEFGPAAEVLGRLRRPVVAKPAELAEVAPQRAGRVG